MKLPKISISTNITAAFGLFFILFASLFIYLSNYYSYKFAKDATQNTFKQVSSHVKSHLSSNYKMMENVLGMIALDVKSSAKVKVESMHPLYRTMKYILQEHPNLAKVYIVDANDNMFELLALKRIDKKNKFFHAPKNTQYIAAITSQSRKEGVMHLFFFDKNDKLIDKGMKLTHFNPKTQIWYKKAKKSNKMIFTAPYLLDHPKKIGVTFAKKMGQNVFGIDMMLQNFDTYLASLASNKIKILLYSKQVNMIYASSSKINAETLSKELKEILKKQEYDSITTFIKRDKRYYLLVSSLQPINNDLIISYVPQKVILEPYIKQIEEMFLYIIAIILFSIPLIIIFSRLLRKPITKLIRENEMIKQRRFDEVRKIDTFIKEFDELSQSQYEMAHEIRAYQKSQEELLNSIIKLIAEAIDAKSLYTGEHCKRVPEIAQMLLDRANKDETIFKDFHFEGADNYRAFEIGSWLHDCGKLTTPEYVMDKSTKLETIYNRIHEIRTRFEVLLRDAKIHEYEVLLAGGEREKANAAYEATKKELMEEFTLVAKLNIGSEFMDATEKEQIEKIALREWVRNFDNTLGLSEEEAERLREDAVTLPQREKLLDDKASHIIKRVNFDYEAYKKEGFKLEVPEYQYNLGEVYNLCIERGTLNAEERYKIQEHVIMTIKMLEQIPFPKELQNVPKYAGTHHETLIGTGYPRKLTKEELSIPERIMAVADIFEALTASDRPYKKAKTLSESLRIISFMVKDEHIDKDIFILFLHSGIYLEYAHAHLREEQIDEVDVEKLIEEIS